MPTVVFVSNLMDEGITLYNLAVSDTAEIIYINPADNYSTLQNLVVFIDYSGTLQYVAFLATDEMVTEKWTAFTLSDLNYNPDNARALNAAEMRTADSNWSFFSYATNSTVTDWGTLYRFEKRTGVFEGTAPAAENVMALSRGSARNSVNPFTISPLARIKWDEYKRSYRPL